MRVIKHFFWVLILSFRISDAQPKLVLQQNHIGKIDVGFFGYDGQSAYTVSTEDKKMKIWDVNSGKLLIDVNLPEESVMYSPSGIDNSLYLFRKGKIDVLDSQARFKFSVPCSDSYDLERVTGTLINRSTRKHGDSYTNELQVYDLKTGNLLFEKLGPTSDKVFSPC